jgi:hypothetical protein
MLIPLWASRFLFALLSHCDVYIIRTSILYVVRKVVDVILLALLCLDALAYKIPHVVRLVMLSALSVCWYCFQLI